jgi:hypothetical protein
VPAQRERKEEMGRNKESAHGRLMMSTNAERVGMKECRQGPMRVIAQAQGTWKGNVNQEERKPQIW